MSDTRSEFTAAEIVALLSELDKRLANPVRRLASRRGLVSSQVEFDHERFRLVRG